MNALARPKVYGAVTIGERGQVVIASDVRKLFKLNAGDKLIVFAKPDMISFVPAEEFNQFLDEASKMITQLKKERQSESN